MSKLVIVGTVAFDAIETPFGKTDKILGGAATYIGLSSAQFDIDPAIVSVVGGDFLQSDIQMLESKGINTQGLEVVKEGKTFFWSGKYHNDMNSRDTLATELNVLETFTPVVPDSYKDAQVVMLGNLHPMVQMSVIEQMHDPKMVVLDTMNFWMDIALDDLKKVISKVDVITINDEEARQLSGAYSLVNASKIIMEMGPKYVVIKKGEHGALIFHEDEMFFAPAMPLAEVFDPTGAGDTFAGGLAGYLASCSKISFDEVKNGVMYGTAIASYCIEDFGPNNIMNLDINLIEKRVSKIKK